MRGTADLEKRVEEAIRRTAALYGKESHRPFPPDPGDVQVACGAVREAHGRGRAEAMGEVIAACKLCDDGDNFDYLAFRVALAELLG